MSRTATAQTTAITPLDIITAAATVITARGYYLPLRRGWEGQKQVPTALDIRALLHGESPYEEGDPQRFARAAAETAGVPATVLQWCRTGGEDGDEYRAKLARAVRRARVGDADISLLASAVVAWRRDQERSARAAEAVQDAATSRHQGALKERLSRSITVTAVIHLGSRTYGYSTRTQEKHLVKLRDDSGNVYVWFATATPPRKGATLTLTGTVKKHSERDGVAETELTRCRWTAAEDADKSHP